MKKIFFSWQSDIKPVRNKFKSALEIVVKQLRDELEEADRPEIETHRDGSIAGSILLLRTVPRNYHYKKPLN